ncbi:hypothetical protein ABU614_06375 [Lysobacter firmicutimachus]|uniref:Preprotein translocase subunit SecA n=1 Tax=Lysobacter firmicutimachus TaxID=1792846 RepID=A0AAU8MWP5_9GAMM|nr:hypothetical protein [Lysobacter antibioticus]
MDPISLEELALLDVLQRIDAGHAPGAHSLALRERLIEAALVEAGDDDGLRLTDAGVERCKSLRHRVAADAEAALVLQEREAAAAAQADASSD